MGRKNELLLRVYVVLIVFLVLAGVIGWKIISISLLEGAKWKKLEVNKYLKWRPVKAQRGDIYSDDAERLMASSIELFEIRMDPVSPGDAVFNKDIDGLCKGLEQVLNTKSRAEWKSILQGARIAYHKSHKSGSRNILISKKVNDETFKQLKTLPLFELGKNKGGLIVNRFYSRKKTYRELASRAIGEYRDKDMVGIERSYDKVLRAAERNELMRFVPPDLWFPLFDPTDFEVIRGKDVVSTIDVDIQDVVHHELAKGLLSNSAEAGVVIVMDVKTGFIKAMSNLDIINGVCREIINRAVTMRTEPGSTFKTATLLALLESGVDVKTTARIDNGKKKFYDLWMYDSNYPHDDKMLDLKESFIKSSNVGIATLAQRTFGTKKGRIHYYDLLTQFGLVEKTGIDLIGEPSPYIKDPIEDASQWSKVTIPWMAHGYELQITPLQTLSFYNAIANDGIYMKPRLVKTIKDGDKVLKEYNPKSRRNRIASSKNITITKDLMKEVVMRGTGKNIYTDEYAIAGKTGTTTFNYSGKGEKGYNASFAGFFPADEPEYSMIVVAYNLRGSKYYGSQVAGPIFRNIADRIMTLKGGIDIAYESETIKGLPAHSKGFGYDFMELYSELGHDVRKKVPRWTSIENEGSHTFAQRVLIRKSQVPDVKGMGLRDAMYVLENIGMKVQAHGSGKVYKQSRIPGTKLNNKSIEIYLN